MNLPAWFRAAAKIFLTVAVAIAGGLTFYYLRLPLPWMLGSMTACGVLAVLRAPLTIPARARIPMSALIGSMLGSSFTLATILHASSIVVPLLAVPLFILIAGLLGFFYFRWIARLDTQTAFFSGMPGGVVEMVLLGAERGADERVISLVQGTRIFMVVMALPFLLDAISPMNVGRVGGQWVPLSELSAEDGVWILVTVVVGMWLGKALRLPAGMLMGPLVISAALHTSGLTHFELPSLLIAGAQIVLGATIGCRFVGVDRSQLFRVLRLSLGANALLLALAFGLAWIVSHLSSATVEELVLAYSPGGLSEMSLIALTLNIDVALVVMAHLMRVVLVSLGGAAVAAWFGRSNPSASPEVGKLG